MPYHVAAEYTTVRIDYEHKKRPIHYSICRAEPNAAKWMNAARHKLHTNAFCVSVCASYAHIHTIQKQKSVYEMHIIISSSNELWL